MKHLGPFARSDIRLIETAPWLLSLAEILMRLILFGLFMFSCVDAYIGTKTVYTFMCILRGDRVRKGNEWENYQIRSFEI